MPCDLRRLDKIVNTLFLVSRDGSSRVRNDDEWFLASFGRMKFLLRLFGAFFLFLGLSVLLRVLRVESICQREQVFGLEHGYELLAH